MKVLVQHHSIYSYPRPAHLGAHLVRLRPADHARAQVDSYRLIVEPESRVYWQRDPHGNHVARIVFPVDKGIEELRLSVELEVDVRPVNPFDFLLDFRADSVPFKYPDGLDQELAVYLDEDPPDGCLAGGPRTDGFLRSLPKGGRTVELLSTICQAVAHRLAYVIREESGVWTPEKSLQEERGSCRDSAVLLVRALRSRGIAARFASGYLIQLKDEGMIPDEPKGVDKDVVDLHAWVEAYLPGAGWIGLDGTSGLWCGEGHIALACTSSPATAAPISGTTDTAAEHVRFETKVVRLGHLPRPTAPYTDEQYEALLAAGDAADRLLEQAGVRLTLGGEPTFCSREHPLEPEWNTDALGESKWSQGLRLAEELRDRLVPGGLLLHRMGKHYPGESLPRWALDICGRTDGEPLAVVAPSTGAPAPDAMSRLAAALLTALGLPGEAIPAFEDPLVLIKDEAGLPPGVDPNTAKLSDGEERRRIARILGQGVVEPTGFVIPLARNTQDNAWLTESWRFRREKLFLIPGDSPIGLRLPLKSLDAAPPVPPIALPFEIDPRQISVAGEDDDIEPPKDPAERARWAIRRGRRQLSIDASDASRERLFAQAPDLQFAPPVPGSADLLTPGIRTALSVERRGDRIWIFLPPIETSKGWLALIEAVQRAAQSVGLAGDIGFEGYPPPSSPELMRFAVTPDPGVLEVNIPPTASCRDHAALLDVVFDAALKAGLVSEKYLTDGRMMGSGGGHHLTVGGPSVENSPFLQRPRLLAGMVALCQRHPSLSYLFTGLFVGPTSQAPRPDEGRPDQLGELELAIERATREPAVPAWMVDALFRHLLVDVSGSTHRAELCIDKLFDPHTHHGRQGLVEMRAFEMPPHPQLAVAQAVLVRSLVAAVQSSAVPTKLRRWGSALHDRFLLPTFLWEDFRELLSFLNAAGVPLAPEAFRPFLELRCPVVGRAEKDGVTLEVRNALEPWNVLGEEALATGTSRFVDSSLERVEISLRGFDSERHRLLVNRTLLPLHATRDPAQRVAGVRFRAWCPPHSLQPHIGIHHPLRFDLVDVADRRSLLSLSYHVWHPEGVAYDEPPLTRFEAAARRAQRITQEGELLFPVQPLAIEPDSERPYSLDLRRASLGSAMPRPEDWPIDGREEA